MIDFRPWSPPALLWLFAARSALSCVQLWARFWGLGERAETTIVPFRGGPAAPARAGAAAGQLIRFARAPAPARTR
jgi:hypothetical protein